MKAQFLVTIEGDWFHNDKRVTVAMVEKSLRKAVKDEFEFLADKRTIERLKADPVGAHERKAP